MSMVIICDFCKITIAGEYRDVRISEQGLETYTLDTFGKEANYDACTNCAEEIRSRLVDWTTGVLSW